MGGKGMAVTTVFVVGTRAQLIKVAPVLVACQRIGHPATLLMTGQHQETMQDLIEEFGITSPQRAALPASERATVGSLASWLPRAFFGVAKSLSSLRAPGSRLDVVVHGDTLSTLVGALAGKLRGGRVVHVESGLTSGRLLDPFPEELTRRLVFRLTDIALCPNSTAAGHMRSHYRCTTIDTDGNTILDAVLLSGARPGSTDGVPYVVASLHRFQNLYRAERFTQLLQLLEAVAARMPVHFVLHPATRKRLEADGHLQRLQGMAGLHLMPRLGYRAFLQLAANAACVLTDGGSNQEELAALGVPTIVMRERTERPDGLGGNACMEAEVEGDLAGFVTSGNSERLRRPSTVPSELGPSLHIARLLADPASGKVR